jgi:hypothetical protein
VAAKPKRAKPGDVLQLNTPKGFAYLQYVGRHSEYGDAVLVNPKLGVRPEVFTSQAFSGGYLVFYPATAAVARGLVAVVDHLAPLSLPQRLRRPGARSGQHIATWIIEDGTAETVKSKLSEDDLRLPIAVIWNHELLTQRVLEGWNPLHEGRAA